MESLTLDNLEYKRMSFVFPKEFYELLVSLKERYGMDMTYIVIEAVNFWVLNKEGLSNDSLFLDNER